MSITIRNVDTSNDTLFHLDDRLFAIWDNTHIVTIGNRPTQNISKEHRFFIWVSRFNMTRELLATVARGCPWNSRVRGNLYYAPDCYPETISVTKKFLFIETIRKLDACYDSGYHFPSWVMDQERLCDPSMFEASHIYYGGPSLIQKEIQTVKKRMLVSINNREPVNMGMERHYDEKLLLKHFFFATAVSPFPNMAVYTHALVKYGEVFDKVHIIHATALDKTFYKTKKKHDANTCIAHYVHMFKMIFECADSKLEKPQAVVLPLIGGGHFADDYPGGKRQFWQYVWIPALLLHLQKNPSHQKRIVGMGFDNSEGFLDMIGDEDLRKRLSRDTCGFPEITRMHNHRSTLFVNEWDAWTIPGNGHGNDPSLSGYVGRSSNVAILSTPMTNPYLKEPSAHTFVQMGNDHVPETSNTRRKLTR
jgi:hypothetical protein